MKFRYLAILLIIGMGLVACQQASSGLSDQPEEPIIEEPINTAPSDTQQEAALATQEIQDTPEAQIPEESSTLESITSSNQETDSACYHPYFPIVEGAYWTYQQPESGGYTLSVEATGPDTFVMTQEMESEGTSYAVDWHCTDDGILRGTFDQMDLINTTIEDEGTPAFQFETLEWEGETLPAPELINVGYAWLSNYKMAADYDLEGFTGQMEVIVEITHEITAIEEVVVPAGTFNDAIRVDSTGKIEMLMLMSESISTPLSNVEFSYSTWYVEGIGMVKSSESISGFETGTELVETSFLD
jgi:hypothetical protein